MSALDDFVLTTSDLNLLSSTLPEASAGDSVWTKGHFGPAIRSLYGPTIQFARADTPGLSVAVLTKSSGERRTRAPLASVAQDLLSAYQTSLVALLQKFRAERADDVLLYRYGGDVWLVRGANAGWDVSYVNHGASGFTIGSRPDFLAALHPSAGAATTPARTIPGKPVHLATFNASAAASSQPAQPASWRRAPLKKQALQILKERGVPVETVLDVGVLSGTSELLEAFPHVKHLLFEPVREFAKSIHANYRMIDYELLEVAVGEESGEITLQTSTAFEGQSLSHSQMIFGQASAGSNTRTVPMLRLDDILRDRVVEAPYLLKIDIDGHELKVVRGASETLKNCSVVIIECMYNSLVERISAVQQAGFRLFDIVEPCYYDKAFWYCDAILIRRDLFEEAFITCGTVVDKSIYDAFR